jgi:hypothetical protein
MISKQATNGTECTQKALCEPKPADQRPVRCPMPVRNTPSHAEYRMCEGIPGQGARRPKARSDARTTLRLKIRPVP